MNTKNILFLIGGLLIGGVSGVFGSKKYYQNKYQKQYDEDHAALEDYYHRTDGYVRKPHDNEEDDQNETETNTRPGGRMNSEERAKVKEQLKRNWEGTTNYANMYKIKHKEDDQKELSEVLEIVDMLSNEIEHDDVEKDTITDENAIEYPKICKVCQYYKDGYCDMYDERTGTEDSCSEFVLTFNTEDLENFNKHQKNKSRQPKIISAEEYSNLPPSIDQNVLYFYAYDEILTEDNEEPINDPETFIGDALTKYNFIESGERVIFVMNYSLDTCYEIQKVDASWTDTH